MGQNHLRAAMDSEHLVVEAVADTQVEIARATAATYDIRLIFSSAEDMIRCPHVDAVVFATPTMGRAAMAIEALLNGKHVLVEKPAGMDADEVRGMIASQGDRVAACCSSRFRFLESASVVENTLQQKTLGAIRVVRARAISSYGPPPDTPPPAWRLSRKMNGGGILMNWGVYDLDYLLGLLRWSVTPDVVIAQTWDPGDGFEDYVAPDSDAESHYTAFIRCREGTVISLERGEFVSMCSNNAWDIVGDRAALRFNMVPEGRNRVYFDKGVPGKGLMENLLWEGEDDPEATQQGPLNDFAQAILKNRPPKTPLDKALIVQQVCDAIYLSARQNRAVTVI